MRRRKPLLIVTAEELIEARRHRFEHLHDPLYAWEAFYLASKYPQWIPMPEWITTYLEGVAERLIAVSRKEPAGRELQQALAEALGVNGVGRASVFARRADLRQRQEYAVDVIAVMRKKNISPTRAIGCVAEVHGTDARTVERAWQKVKKTGWLPLGGYESGVPLPSPKVRD